MSLLSPAKADLFMQCIQCMPVPIALVLFSKCTYLGSPPAEIFQMQAPVAWLHAAPPFQVLCWPVRTSCPVVDVALQTLSSPSSVGADRQAF